MENKRILVIGGTGYIGKEIVPILSKSGYSVFVFPRTLPNVLIKHVRYIKGDLRFSDSLIPAMEDVDIVIYLAAVVRSLNKNKFKQNIVCLKNTIKAMKQQKVKKLLYFSTINVTIPKTGSYGNSKKECEGAVKTSALDYVIARPNFVYGIDKNSYFYTLYSIMKKSHILLTLGNPNKLFEPINKKDVAVITLKLIKNWKKGRIVHLSGKEKLSFSKVGTLIKKLSKISAINITIPMWLLKFFKIFISFDVNGVDKDQVARNDVIYGSHSLHQDIQKIINQN